MIAAVLASGDPRTIERHSQAIARVVKSAPSDSTVGAAVGLFAHRGHPDGHLDAQLRAAWIGSVRNFTPTAPSDMRGDFALVAASGEQELLLAKGRFGG